MRKENCVKDSSKCSFHNECSLFYLLRCRISHAWDLVLSAFLIAGRGRSSMLTLILTDTGSVPLITSSQMEWEKRLILLSIHYVQARYQIFRTILRGKYNWLHSAAGGREYYHPNPRLSPIALIIFATLCCLVIHLNIYYIVPDVCGIYDLKVDIILKGFAVEGEDQTRAIKLSNKGCPRDVSWALKSPEERQLNQISGVAWWWSRAIS